MKKRLLLWAAAALVALGLIVSLPLAASAASKVSVSIGAERKVAIKNISGQQLEDCSVYLTPPEGEILLLQIGAMPPGYGAVTKIRSEWWRDSNRVVAICGDDLVGQDTYTVPKPTPTPTKTPTVTPTPTETPTVKPDPVREPIYNDWPDCESGFYWAKAGTRTTAWIPDSNGWKLGEPVDAWGEPFQTPYPLEGDDLKACSPTPTPTETPTVKPTPTDNPTVKPTPKTTSGRGVSAKTGDEGSNWGAPAIGVVLAAAAAATAFVSRRRR